MKPSFKTTIPTPLSKTVFGIHHFHNSSGCALRGLFFRDKKVALFFRSNVLSVPVQELIASFGCGHAFVEFRLDTVVVHGSPEKVYVVASKNHDLIADHRALVVEFCAVIKQGSEFFVVVLVFHHDAVGVQQQGQRIKYVEFRGDGERHDGFRQIHQNQIEGSPVVFGQQKQTLSGIAKPPFDSVVFEVRAGVEVFERLANNGLINLQTDHKLQVGIFEGFVQKHRISSSNEDDTLDVLDESTSSGGYIDGSHAPAKIFVRLAGFWVVLLFFLFLFFYSSMRIRLGGGDRTRGRRWSQTFQGRRHSDDVGIEKLEDGFFLVVRNSVVLAFEANGPFDVFDALQSPDFPTEPNTGLFHEFSVPNIGSFFFVPRDNQFSVFGFVDVELEIFFHVMPSLSVSTHYFEKLTSGTIPLAATTAFFAHVVGNIDLGPGGNGLGGRCVVEFVDFRVGVGPVSVSVVQVVVGRNHDGVVRSLDDHQSGLDPDFVVWIPAAPLEPLVFDPVGGVHGRNGIVVQDFAQKCLAGFGPGRGNLCVCLALEILDVGCVLRIGAQAHLPGHGSDGSADHLGGRLALVVRLEDHAPWNLDDILPGFDRIGGVDAHRGGGISRDLAAQF
ncbi:unnamed protein product [Pseudo-nitzschia multistriata]|uniref:Uncharacterized protein n=1 Tax=Pseudo-nitzschia multistriata TaxID=183589 RepID=A0A448Z131_9STRA|nr:unnamed protein product [Pseudo-nitzschia multistriata]